MRIQNTPSFTGWYKITLPQVYEDYEQKACQNVYNTIRDIAGEYQKDEVRVLSNAPITFVNIQDRLDSVFKIAINKYLNFVNGVFDASGIERVSVKKIQPNDYEDIFQLQTSKSLTQLFNEQAEQDAKQLEQLEKQERFQRLFHISPKKYLS